MALIVEGLVSGFKLVYIFLIQLKKIKLSLLNIEINKEQTTLKLNKKELLESVQKKIGAPKSYTKEDSSWKDLKCSQISKTIQLALFKKEQAANQGKNISTMIRNYIGKLLLLLKHQASFLFR